MQKPPADIDRITTLLSQCLGRIDEQVLRIQQQREEATDFLGDVLESEAATLQELMDSLIQTVLAEDRADLNRTVAQVVESCLAETDIPVVVRQQLAPGLPPVDIAPSQLAVALRRALSLAIGQMPPGSELLLQTRCEEQELVLEIECSAAKRDRHLNARAATLCEFVANLAGLCRVGVHDNGSLLLSLQLPRALASEER